ncbi:MAG: hypothetical protein AB1426_03360 [Bacillota bacterium]
MERFRKYIGKTLILDNVKDRGILSGYGITSRYLPDPPEDFDEFEFAIDFAGQTVVLLVTVEKKAVKRLLFSLADQDDPDVTRPLSETQLQEFLSQKGEQLTGFFDHITG